MKTQLMQNETQMSSGKKSNSIPSVLVTFLKQDKDNKKSPLTWVTPSVAQSLENINIASFFKAAKNETTLIRGVLYKNYQGVMLAGMGSEKFDQESWRQMGGALMKAIKANKLTHVTFLFDGLESFLPQDLGAMTEGLCLGAYDFNQLKTASKESSEVTFNFVATAFKNKEYKTSFDQAQMVAESVNESRRLGDLPGNYLPPRVLALEAQKLFKGLPKTKVTVWDKKRIEKERMGGLLTVGKGSAEDPRFIIIEYKGAAVSEKPIVLVGKGLTFDSGGISIKPSAAMEEMKYDMCGAANVIGALHAVAKLGLKVNVVGLIASAENMPSHTAVKPGDVYTSRNGKTVEVNNTDAEGRLVLGEALVYASELSPQLIIDAATLTGAMAVALGNLYTGYFTKNSELKTTIEEAAKASGEWVWNMPLCSFHSEDMKGVYADLSNISSGKGAGSSTAAAFLEQFVGQDKKGNKIPWAHFDIAGTAWAVGNRLNYCPSKGASGVMVRTFLEIIKSKV